MAAATTTAASAAAAAANVDEVRRREKKVEMPTTDNGGGPGVRERDRSSGFVIFCWPLVLYTGFNALIRIFLWGTR